MVIVPSIDVRAARVTYRGVDVRAMPSELADRYVRDGAQELHLVDRDMAERGEPANLALLAAIARRAGVPCRLAGGIASVAFAREVLDAGFAGVLFSSAVFGSAEVLRDVAALGAAAIVELEVRRDPPGGTAAWLSPRGPASDLAEEARGRGALAAARAAAAAGISDLYVIDLGREGALDGPAVDLLDDVRASLGDGARRMRFHTGGGISSLEDVRALARWGAASAVIGRALLEGRLTLPQAQAAAR